MRSKIDRKTIADRTQHRAEHMPGKLSVEAGFFADFVQPDMSRLNGALEDGNGGTHADLLRDIEVLVPTGRMVWRS
jgi:hypothetical protein